MTINFVDWSTFSEKDFEHIKETTGRYYGKNSFKAGAVEFDIWGPSDYAVSGDKIFVDCRIRQPDKDTVSSEVSVVYNMPGSIPEAQLDSMSYESFQKGINLFLCNELAGEHASQYPPPIEAGACKSSD